MDLTIDEINSIAEQAALRAVEKYKLENDRSLSINEAKDYLGISRATIYVMINEGDLVPHYVGKHQKFTKAELDRARLTSRSPVTGHVRFRPPISSRSLLNESA